MKNIEVEVRGPLTKKQYFDLEKKFYHEGKFIDDKNRLAVCYPDPETGSLVERCNTDIRVRCTNGIPEFIVKQGKWGSVDESRLEISLKGLRGEFHKMIMMLGAMGFKTGMAVVRYGKVFEFKGVEFSLVEVPGHSYFFEAEMMVWQAEKAQALKQIKTTCRELGLRLFDEQGFYDYINRLNKEANKEFLFDEYDEDYFSKNFGMKDGIL